MTQLRLLAWLLQPSFLSSIVCLVGAGVILVVGSWSSFTHSPFLYDYFFGPFGLVTMLQTTPGPLAASLAALAAQPFAYNIIILIISALVGGLVYLILQIISHLLANASNTLLDIGVGGRAAEQVIGARIGIRLLVLIAWVCYIFFSIKILTPFSLFAAVIGASQLPTLSGWGYCALGFTTLCLGIHLHVVFTRLFALRPRLL